MADQVKCPKCDGSGKGYADILPCEVCRGETTVPSAAIGARRMAIVDDRNRTSQRAAMEFAEESEETNESTEEESSE